MALCIIYALSIPCAAQVASPCIIEGRVLCADTDKTVAGAFISFIQANKIISSCQSGEDGSFRMTFNDTCPDVVSVSMLGYAPTKVKAVQGHMTIRLNEKKINIKAASVSSNVVETQGDTTSYSAAAFLDKGDMTAADILKKIPGVTITKSGGIIHNGKPINKFYIEGLDMMGGRYGTVTNNLSVNDISKIEIYRDHQPVKAMKGIVHTGSSAVNIILKESSRNTWLFNGDLAAGAPDFPLFEARAMTMRFSKKSQDLYMLKGNNTGYDIIKEIREQSYFGKTGAFLISNNDIDSDFNSELSPRKKSVELPQEFWYDNISGIGTFNHLHKTGQDSQVRASVQIAAETYSEKDYTNESISFDDSPELIISENSEASDVRYYFNASVHYENNTEKNFLSNEFGVSGQMETGQTSALSGISASSQQYRLPSLKVNNTLKATTRTRHNKAIDVSSTITFLTGVHSADFHTDSKDFRQDLKSMGFRTRNSVAYRFNVGKVGFNSHIGFNLEHIRRKSYLGIPLEAPLITDENFIATSVAPFINLFSTYTKGGCRLRIGMSATLNMIFTPTYGKHFLPDLSPQIFYTQKLGQNWELGADAGYSRSNSEVLSLSKAVIMKSYRSAKVSDGITNTDRVTSKIHVRYSDTPAMLFMTLTGNCGYTRRDKTSSNIYDDYFVLSTLVTSPVSYRNFGVNGNISKYFGIKTFVMEISGGYDRYRSGEYLQEKYFSYSGEHAYASLKARTSALDWLSADLSVNYDFDRMVGNKSSGRHSVAAMASLIISPVKPMQLGFNADYYWWHSSSAQESVSNIPILKCHISWKFKKFSIFAECRNILGTNEFKKEYFTPHKTVSNVFHLRGREYLAGIRMSM